MIAPSGYRKKDVALIVDLFRSTERVRGEADLEDFLPLNDAAYLVMLALDTRRESDRGFLEAVEESARTIAPGHLVGALDRMIELGLVTEVVGSDRRHYRVTALGDAVLYVETGRRSRQFDLPTMPTLETLIGRRVQAS